ncbi:MAG: 3-deoxy-D-manno-octulosonic acid transferase [Gammaproteobacteria bacterium]|nr:MAG: 3-deoxy-D-manno-octulosonic acid transferase [Gammaproteobacteria bacterium]
MRFVYLLAVYLAAPVICAVFLWRGLRDRGYWRNFRQRFGFGARTVPHGVWIHAVSVGEVQACAPLVGVLRQRYPELPLTVTAVTPTGAARARALFGNAAQVRYVPFDLPGAVRRFFARVQPRLAVIVETELWPNLYRECARRRVPLVLASARLSARSVGRYRRLGALFRDTLSQAAVVAAQGRVDAQRFAEVAALLHQAGASFVRRSQGAAAAAQTCEVLLLDSLGELLDFYAAADVAFVGGSLVPIGGHNLLEPAALGVPILTGPYNSNSEEIARLLIAGGAAEVVRDAATLGARVSALLANPEARVRIGAQGRASVDSNRGALGKLLGLIEPLLNEP